MFKIIPILGLSDGWAIINLSGPFIQNRYISNTDIWMLWPIGWAPWTD